MNIKQKLIMVFWCIMVLALVGSNYFANKYVLKASSLYQVYLNGETLGFIENDDALYKLINNRQKEIKEKYNVNNVYPPKDFEIIKINTYNNTVSSAEDIYDKIAALETFTVEGFIIMAKNEEEKKEVTINVFDKSIFDEAINNFIIAFIDEADYQNYMNNTQVEIETTGKIIEKMNFDEVITIKRGLIGVDQKIYTDANELSQHLLFGKDYEIEKHKVVSGDTIASISEKNKLNVQEFLIANPEYTSEDSMLKIGDEVNITLINPLITLSYDVHEVSDAKIPFENKVEIDKNRPATYSEITTVGVNGITRITQKYVVKNGEREQGVEITDRIVITEKVDQVTTKGAYYSGVSGEYVDTGTVWQWPTNQPYVLTSHWGWRWGAFHDGVDISGTGHRSPIYASLDGTVIASGWGGIVGESAGCNVVLSHENGYYTVYAHLNCRNNAKYCASSVCEVYVAVGDYVTRGQVIGAMGTTGVSTGTHLHFGLFKGMPYGGGQTLNPLSLW